VIDSVDNFVAIQRNWGKAYPVGEASGTGLEPRAPVSYTFIYYLRGGDRAAPQLHLPWTHQVASPAAAAPLTSRPACFPMASTVCFKTTLNENRGLLSWRNTLWRNIFRPQ
jgi:hypothetical protein